LKSQTLWYPISFIIFLFFSLHLLGCAAFGPTQPNLPYAGKAYPAVLNELAQTNPLFVNELGKLPELQDDLSEKEISALNNIIELNRKYPDNFEDVFNLMYQVGIPEIRKYCSPLQALFWLAEEGNVISLNDIVIAYSLEKLLDRAWIFKPSMFKSKNELLEIIAGINNDAKKIIYLMDLKYYDLAEMQAFLFIDYKNNPKMFSKNSRTKIEKGMAMGNLKSKWDNFDVVVERLNSPELLDYYERHVLRYKYQRGYGEGPAQAKRVFKNKYGHCAQFTAFTVYILQKAGYEAHRYIAANPALKSPRGNYHRACLFMVKGKKYIMDNGRHIPIGIVRFEDYGDAESRKEDAKLQDIPMLL
jgi:hypothetical protein